MDNDLDKHVDYLNSPDVASPPQDLIGGGLEQRKPSIQERIIQGKGLEVVQEIGWTKFRQTLVEIPYAEIAEALNNQSLAVQSTSTDQKLSGWVLHTKNSEALAHARQLSQKLIASYPKNGSASHYVVQEGTKKLWIYGKNAIPLGNSPEDELRTRVYFTVPTMHSPEAFDTLRTMCVDRGIMGQLDLALNLEIFQTDSLEKPFENNAIIAYVTGRKPQILEELMKSIKTTKGLNPRIWQLPLTDLSRAKIKTMRDFMIPLDETTSFVEMPDGDSYHSAVAPFMANEILGGYGFNKVPEIQVLQNLRIWTPNNPGLFTQHRLPERRKYMPALLFPKTGSTNQ